MSWQSEHKDMMLKTHSNLKLRKSREEPIIHDYTSQRWGWSLMDITKKNKDLEDCPLFTTLGFGLDIRVGDSLLLNMQSGKTARFEVEEIEYYRDPKDMWKGIIKAIEYID